jgi:Zn-dependent peptidase ImmA (M78 family)
MAQAAHHSIGEPGGLRFDLAWANERPAEGISLAFGNLKAWVGPDLIWGRIEDEKTCGVDWYWDELLDVLARSWRFLIFEEAYPLGLRPSVPQLLRSKVRENWLGMPDEIINAEDNFVLGFEQAHDLSRSIEGAVLPMLLLLREGNLMLAATNSGVERLPFNSTLSTLESLGDLIASQIAKANDKRADNILSAWKSRCNVPVIDRVEISSSLSKSTLAVITKGDEFEKFWEINSSNFEPNELMAAARMVGKLLSDDDTRTVVQSIKRLPSTRTDGLDEVSVRAKEYLSAHTVAVAHEQGRSLAEWMRLSPGVVDEDDTVDPERLLHNWNVKLGEIDIKSENLDALCCWGPRHGPCILVNKNGRLAHYPTGRRSTLAHEICHLLVDRAGSLPLAEALGGDVPEIPEQRANAFAAELLLPRYRAHKIWSESESVDEALAELSTRYHVSYEVAAWQILKSSSEIPAQDKNMLLKHTYRHGT